MTKGRPKTGKVTRSIRLDPEVAKKIDRYAYGEANPLINELIRDQLPEPVRVSRK